ncbi:hypothetical protein M2454_001713 [Aequitasia blattaphilus]|uniref:DUF3343 domain-containing protein n=1 Tax=Aequitasia blattaphilus TaxID=2949332 RepID=A0ABT1EC36_9FIRM|nr:DUF3343 domain-containing protein [Aequitasia blattaphilus]MCP1102067.1 DUF3343 domain-containing protein [Aequitasia blattaphilus]MCR8614707.1 DUF3343 domain-containing protein [Aequitasia blattaphilus]
MKEIWHYILFPNHENGMRLYKELGAIGIKTTIAPTPRSLSKCCGISLLIKKEDIEAIQKCIQEHSIEILEFAEVEKDINPNRDRYC